MRPEIREVDDAISVKYTNQTYILEVQAFGNHLGTYQHIGLAVLKICDNLLVTVLLFGRVQVHALHFGVWQHQLQIIFNLFGTKAHTF